jgi:hypothetical protein
VIPPWRILATRSTVSRLARIAGRAMEWIRMADFMFGSVS